MIPPLYKYLSVDAARAVLENRTLRWSTPKTLNDPNDMQTGLQLNLPEQEVVSSALEKIYYRLQHDIPAKNKLGEKINALRSSGVALSKNKIDELFTERLFNLIEKFKKRLPAFNADVLSALASFKILCLSSTRQQQLMWAHYADGHSGVVLEFCIPQGIDSPLKSAKAVNYVDNPPNILTKEQLASFLSGDERMEPQALLDRFVYTKGGDWSYESEWRISAAEGRAKNEPFESVGFYSEELVSVTFGCKTTEPNIALFKELAVGINPAVKFFRTQSVGFTLNFIAL